MPTHKTLSILALSLLVAACDFESGANCDKLTESLENAANCVLARRNNLPFDVEACDRDIKRFVQLGLTSHDATKITKVGVEDFYETYYTDDFCKFMYPKWISRNVE